eukprot:181164-Pleurochrysis_carterae.AAC.2
MEVMRWRSSMHNRRHAAQPPPSKCMILVLASSNRNARKKERIWNAKYPGIVWNISTLQIISGGRQHSLAGLVKRKVDN